MGAVDDTFRRLDSIDQAVNELDSDVLGVDDVGAMAIAMEFCRVMARDLNQIAQAISERLTAEAESDAFDTPVGRAKKSPDWRRSNWSEDLPVRALTEVLRRPPLSMTEDAARTLARAVAPRIPARLDWRVGRWPPVEGEGLRGLGFDTRDECDEEKLWKWDVEGTLMDKAPRLRAAVRAALRGAE